jgi:iron complex outermembrane recepter protein
MITVTTHSRRSAWLATTGLLLPVLGFGQARPLASAPDDVVELSPFTVDTSSDRGYYSPQSVSGTRTRTELINLPMNISVFNDQFIQDIGARDLLDVVVYSAGVTQGTGGGSDTGGGDTLGFTLRGQAGFVPYRNGFRRLRVVDPATIDRVEVVKGPSSVLYGFAFPGGMVNYITKRPVPREQGHASVRVGSYDFYKATVDYNAPLGDQVAMRLVAGYEDSKSWADRHHAKTTVLYPSITWWIRPTTTVTLEYESTKRHTDSPRSGLPFHATLNILDQGWDLDHSWNSRAPWDYQNVDMTVYTAEVVHRFNDAFTARANWTNSIWTDDVLTNTSPVGLPNPAVPLLNNRAFSAGKRGSWDEYFQTELVNNFSFRGIDAQNIVGYQRGEEEFRQVRAYIAPPAQGPRWDLRDRSTWLLTGYRLSDSPGLAASTGTTVANTLNTLYFTNQLSFFDGRFRTLAGYRIDRLRADSNINPNAPSASQSTSWAEPSKTPQFGLLYKITDEVSIYGQYSESLVNLYTGLQRSPDGSFYTPVPGKGEGYDVGIKAELFEGRIAGNVSVFQVDNRNIIRFLPSITLPNGELITPTAQSGLDRSTGLETDLRLRLFPGNQIVLSYANTDAYVKSDRSNAASVVIDGVRYFTREGHRLSNAPEHTAAIWVRQDLGTFGRLTNTFVAGGGRYVSERAFTETYNNVGGVLTPPPNLDDYMVFDFSVGGAMELNGVRYRGAISVKNVLDEFYVQQRFAFGAPRTFEFSISASF